MATECATGWTAVDLTTLNPDGTNKMYQFDTNNNKIIVGAHTTYFSNMFAKDACKIKTCTWV